MLRILRRVLSKHFNGVNPISSYKAAIKYLYNLYNNNTRDKVKFNLDIEIDFKRNKTDVIFNTSLKIEDEMELFCNRCVDYSNLFYGKEKNCKQCKLNLFKQQIEERANESKRHLLKKLKGSDDND